MSINWHIQDFDTLPSTQDHLKSLDAPAHGLVICTKTQSAGYGRHGRGWISGRGNLTLSLCLRSANMTRDKIGLLALGVGLAINRTVKAVIPKDFDCRLKWPNDILIEGRKCAGLLLEPHGDFILIGIGLNVACAPHNESAAHLNAYAPTVTAFGIRHNLLTHIDDIYTLWIAQKYDTIRTDFLKNTFDTGTPMSVKVGKTITRGLFENIDDNGALMLRNDRGAIKTITAGDVFVAG